MGESTDVAVVAMVVVRDRVAPMVVTASAVA